MTVSNSINQMYEEMKGWRQDLHRIPEIGLEEYETSKYIKSKLSEFNIKFQDEIRAKKPIGIYWLQSFSAKIFGSEDIGSFRLPSL